MYNIRKNDKRLGFENIKTILMFLFLFFIIPIKLFAAGTVVFSDDMTNFPAGWNAGLFVADDVAYNSSPRSACTNTQTYAYLNSTFDLSSYDELRFQYYTKKDNAGGYMYIKVEVTNNNWGDVYSLADGEYTWPWTCFIYDVPLPYFGSTTKFRIYKQYTGASITNFDDIVITANKKPILSWTEEAGYENDGVDPVFGSSNTIFTYRIKYTDGDNDPPASEYPRVIISSGGIIISTIAMNYATGEYTTGAIYSTSTLLSPCSYYEYTFQAYDGWLYATAVSSTGPDVKPPLYIQGYIKDTSGNNMQNVEMSLTGDQTGFTYTDTSGYYEFLLMPVSAYIVTPSSFNYYTFAPSSRTYDNLLNDQINQDFTRINYSSSAALAWTEEIDYEADGLNLVLGSPDTSFVYHIKYKDPENDIPGAGYPEVYIKKGGSNIIGSPFAMTETDAGDTNCMDGKIYSYSTLLSSGADYTYSFQAYDIYNTSSTAPDDVNAPDVSNPPALSWTGEANYTTDGIEPHLGLPTTSFIYRVNYTDSDNDAPKAGYPTVHIKKDGNEIDSSPFTMTAADTEDTIFDDGKVYFKQITLSTGMDYTYEFEARDIWDVSSSILISSGPEVRTYVNGQVKDFLNNPMQNVLMTLSEDESQSCYTDINGYYQFFVTTMNYIITPSSFAYYYFNPSSMTYSDTQAGLSGQDFVRVSSAPTLAWSAATEYEVDGVYPDIGTSTMSFTFEVKYSDIETDSPADGYPRVVISSGDYQVKVITMVYNSGNYDTGAIYSTSTLLDICTYYTYTFQANDIYNTPADNLSQSGPRMKTQVSGYVKDSSNQAMQNVLISMTGDETDSVYTDINGYYELMITTMSYTITPSSFAYYSFTPVNREHIDIQMLQENQDFTRTSGAPVLAWTGEAGYEVDGISPDIGTSTTSFSFNIKYTDSDNDAPAVGYPRVVISSGSYQVKVITMVYVSGDYDTGAIYSTSTLLDTCTCYEYTFQADDILNTSANDISKFGPRMKTRISGYVKDPGNVAMENVLMSMTGDEADSLYTDVNGYYEFLITTMNYTVTPSSSAYYSFNPANKVYTGTETNLETENYVRLSLAPGLSWAGEAGYETDGIQPGIGTYLTVITYKIKYTDPDNDAPPAGYPRVVISAGDVVINTIQMNCSSEDYLSGVIYSTSTLLSPCSYYDYTFQVKDIFDTSAADVSSSGPDIRTSIEGYVFDSTGIAMSDVLMTLSGDSSSVYTTDNLGYYQFGNLMAGHNYIITPSSFAYYTFSPVSRTHANITNNQIDQNFIASGADIKNSNVKLTLAGEETLALTSYRPEFEIELDYPVTTTAVSGIEIQAVSDNKRKPVSSAPVQLNATISSAAPTKMKFTPAVDLASNYVYRLTVTTNMVCATGEYIIQNSHSYEFTTPFDANVTNVFTNSNGVYVTCDPRAFASLTNGSIEISSNPMESPIVVNPAIISQANSKVFAQNIPNHYVLDGSITELVLYDDKNDIANIELQANVFLTIPYPDTDNDGFVDGMPGLAENHLMVYWLNEQDMLWVRQPRCRVDTAANTVTVQLSHFSVYALMASPGDIINNIYAYPVPFEPNSNLGHITITFTEIPEGTKIYIYTITGRLVQTLIESDADGMYVWDVTDKDGNPLPSDIYFYVAIDRAGSSKKSKLAVIR